jgi:uroporphyrinogen III methyltransferase/synthase
VIERGTLPGQRSVTGTLGSIAAQVETEGIRPPAITLVGAVARLGDELAWIGHGPLAGRRVVVTRARAQASGLAGRLRQLGAVVVEAPAIRIDPRPVEGEVEAAARSIADYSVVCVTSPNGAQLLLDALDAVGADARALAGARVAAIGPGTARELLQRGIRADIVATTSTAEGLLEALAAEPLDGARVLVARAAEARDTLPEGLRERGASVDVIALYDTVAEAGAEDVGQADYVTFTSSSTVRFFTQTHGVPNGARVVSIGPVTSATARELGVEVHAEAERHDIDGLVEALLADAARA